MATRWRRLADSASRDQVGGHLPQIQKLPQRALAVTRHYHKLQPRRQAGWRCVQWTTAGAPIKSSKSFASMNSTAVHEYHRGRCSRCRRAGISHNQHPHPFSSLLSVYVSSCFFYFYLLLGSHLSLFYVLLSFFFFSFLFSFVSFFSFFFLFLFGFSWFVPSCSLMSSWHPLFDPSPTNPLPRQARSPPKFPMHMQTPCRPRIL